MVWCGVVWWKGRKKRIPKYACGTFLLNLDMLGLFFPFGEVGHGERDINREREMCVAGIDVQG